VTELDTRIIAAHTAGEGAALVELYRQAAETVADPVQAAFYLTHAHVFALETGHAEAAALRDMLIADGREAPLPPPIAPRR
jgi:hypothetical protein